MNNPVNVSLLVDIMKHQLILLEQLSDSMLLLQNDLKNDQTDGLDDYTEKHDRLISRLLAYDKESEKLVESLNSGYQAVLKSIFTDRLSESDCPSWAAEIFSMVGQQRTLADNLTEVSKQSALLIQKAMDSTKSDMVKSNKSETVYNYYLSLQNKQTGILLDIKE